MNGCLKYNLSKKELSIEQQIEKLEAKLEEPSLVEEQRQKLEQHIEELYKKMGGRGNGTCLI
ncbi:hypothetical protein OL548_14925 [Lysinibacillus sp. MHQ-1]|nr:hypothetical protein OL548_14925 [Lysinibacillus sp. MHQ-1]